MSEIRIRDNIMRVPVEQIYPNVWNPNRQSDFIYAAELTSIKTHGFLDPIDVREIPEGFEIVDGEHRWKAAKELGMTEIPVNNLGQVTPSVAKQLTIIRNETRGQAERSALSKLLQDLATEVSVDELKLNLPYQAAEIDSLLKETAIDWENVKGDISGGGEPGDEEWEEVSFRLPASVAAMVKEQVLRFKKIIHPEEKELDKISPVQPIECMMLCLAQTPDDQVL